LALGNGAPDVAATMNAMLQDEKNGYLLAMGELTGTTMFVSAGKCKKTYRELERILI
jgi:sodium/potassium/calcium exchanger 6